MKIHFSELLGYSNFSHTNYTFVDINVLDDQKLFIDPCLIMTNNDTWCRMAIEILDNFYDKFYEAYRNNNDEKKSDLLKHANEINYTKLGYGTGKNGHGNTTNGLLEIFKQLDNFVQKVPSISKPMDLPIVVSGFSEDGLSDMITNILHEQLNEFTLAQLKKANKEPNSEDTFYTWDLSLEKWKEVTRPCYRFEERDKILLTPKNIVRKKYNFGVNQFLMRIILERAKNETAYLNDKGKTCYRTSKKELRKNISKVESNWRYTYTREKSEEDSTFFQDYHNAIPGLYIDKVMSDSDLDSCIY